MELSSRKKNQQKTSRYPWSTINKKPWSLYDFQQNSPEKTFNIKLEPFLSRLNKRKVKLWNSFRRRQRKPAIDQFAACINKQEPHMIGQ